MPGHGGNRTYDLWNTSPILCQLSYAVRSVRVCDISEHESSSFEGTRLSSEISHTSSKELHSVPKYHILEPT